MRITAPRMFKREAFYRTEGFAEDIVNGEINSFQGYFNYQAYIISQNGEIEITRPTWDKTEIYITNLRNDDYKFQFAIQNYVKEFP